MRKQLLLRIRRRARLFSLLSDYSNVIPSALLDTTQCPSAKEVSVNKDNQSFLDTRTILAVLLVGATFVGWQTYMQRKYPDSYGKKAATSSASAPTTTTAGKDATATVSAQAQAPAVGATESAPRAVAPAEEKFVAYKSDTLAFDISSRGMGIKTFKILKYKTREDQIVELGNGHGMLALETRLTGHTEPLEFQIEKVNPNLFVGRAQSGGIRVTKTIEIVPEKYVLNYKILAEGSDDRFIGLTTTLIEDIDPDSTLSALNPRRLKQEFYVETAEHKDRILFDKEDVLKAFNKVQIASVGSQYFTQAVLDRSNVLPEAKADLSHASKTASILLNYPVLNKGQNFELNFTAFVGPKALNLLQQVDDRLAQVVDFGFFNWIGRRILELLRWFHVLVGNWGLAIICLTLLVRVLVLPANIYSYKSMRAMQAIQPQIQAMREKYKDDQQKQQQEMMALMKSNKVNPVGGCLPLLLQTPIFFALYQVLDNCIELYQANFGLWIHDLSLKDPYYILPALMGLTMFIQQKITPNTMEPAQAKMMLFMPLIFTVFMVQLPSGLTLYMLVGAVFSVVQMMYFMKPTKTLVGTK